MTVALVVTTYNRPDALEIVLRSALRQSRRPDEIVVADDGSTEATREVIEKVGRECSVPLMHAWQPDENFRAAMARNRAIAMTESDYVVMIDGDMILHPLFVQDHLEAAEEGGFIQGGRALLNQETTEWVIRNGVNEFSFFSSGIQNRKNTLRSRLLSQLFSRKNHSLRGIKTCNFSLFRKDILAVNGFDNRFVGWGREDSEFAVRLLNSGLIRKNLKFAAIAYHLYHPENPRNSLPQNDRRLQRSIEEKLIWCEDGIDRFLPFPQKHDGSPEA